MKKLLFGLGDVLACAAGITIRPENQYCYMILGIAYLAYLYLTEDKKK